MSLFIDREAELGALEKFYGVEGAQLVIIWGRRRIGKTELVAQFVRDKPHFNYLAKKLPLAAQVKDFLKTFCEQTGEYVPDISEWVEGFKFVLGKSATRGKKFVITIDEFPYLIEGDMAVPSVFQAIWDGFLRKENVMLILLGSSVSMMETEVLGYKSPLYGRRSGQLKLEQFDFGKAREFFPRWPIEQAVCAYGILGGVPAYLAKFDPDKGLWVNVEQKILDRTELLYDEPQILLKEELREPTTYQIVLEAIAAGKGRVSEIANLTGIPFYNLPKYLRVLVNLGFVEKRYPVTAKRPRPRDTFYALKDNFFNFWFRYVWPHRSEIETGNIATVLKKIKSDFGNYIGRFIFEQIALQFLAELNRKGKLPLRFTKAGRWWDRGEEIDIVALDEDKREATFIEVKWADLRGRECEKILNQLREKSGLVKWKRVKERFGIVARAIEDKGELRRSGYFVWDLEDITKI
jgi:AAA+ ATPase superfamily predicted ATPase